MSTNGKPAVGAAGGVKTEHERLSAHPSYSTARTQSQAVHAASGQVVGQVRGDVFAKTVRASVHFLRKPPAIAFDLCSLQEAQDLGARLVCVRDSETGRQYLASVDAVWHFGFEFDRGFGRQLALPLERWSVFGRDNVPYVQAQLGLKGGG